MEFKAILMTCTLTLIVIRVIQKITHNDMIKACTAISAVIALIVVVAMTIVFRANSETFWALKVPTWIFAIAMIFGAVEVFGK